MSGAQVTGETPVAQAVAHYLALRVAEGAYVVGTDTFYHQRRHLSESLCDVLGSRPLGQIRASDIRAWMHGIRHKKTGAALHPNTVRHYLKAAKTFFRRATVEEWIEKNPTMAVVPPKVPQEPVNLIGVQDAFHFFKANAGHRSVARLALEAFGGVRCSTAGKLQSHDIKFERRGIEMPAVIHKSQRRKFRQGHPHNLWAWLAIATSETWEIGDRTYFDDKQQMHLTSGLRQKVDLQRAANDEERERMKALRNVWRHSFASYLLAIEKQFTKVCYLMQHTRISTTEIYEGMADETDARLYFAITPETVRMKWEDFRASVLRTKFTMEPESVPASMWPREVAQPKCVSAGTASDNDWRAG